MGRPGAVGAHEDRLGFDDLARELLERVGEHGDLVAGVVCARVAGTQLARQRHPARLAVGAVQVGQQRMKPEPALVGAARAVLVRVRGDQRRVDVDNQRPGRSSTQRERPLARRRARRPDRVEQPDLGDVVDHPPRRRIRRHRPEQRGLVAQAAQVTQRVAADSEHHRQIPHHPARIVPAAPLPEPGQPRRQRPGQPEPIGGLSQQRRTRVVDRLIVSVRPHCHGYLAAIALHLQGDPPKPGSRPSTSRRIPAQADVTAPRSPAGAPTTARSGLKARELTRRGRAGWRWPTNWLM